MIDVPDLAGTTILSGAPSGRELFAKLIAVLPSEPVAPEPLLLDFRRVEVATASFLRESILAFRTFVRGRRSNLYPAIANASAEVTDEVIELVQPRGEVLMACSTDEAGGIVVCRHLGRLDPMQQLTFDLVNARGETTVTDLMAIGNGDVKATAWNNRLASLSSLGLISEQSRGRAKTYRPIFAGVCHGR